VEIKLNEISLYHYMGDPKEIHKEHMKLTFVGLTEAPQILKKTNNIYCNKTRFLKIERVDSFYIENNQKYTWLRFWKGRTFIYGEPFNPYNF